MSGSMNSQGNELQNVGEPQAGIPLLSDFGAAEEMSTKVGRSNKTRRVAVAGLVILGAAGGIYVMRQVGLGAASVIASIVVDYDPNEFKIGPGDPAVLAELERGRLAVQVPAETLEQDPFRLIMQSTDQPVIEAPRQVVSAEELARQQREKKIKDAAAQVDVQSVMGGPIPLARINGTMVRLGDTVLEIFRVHSIEGRAVVLRAGSQLYGYQMGEQGVKWTRSTEEAQGGP
jgi:hypothetical protein